MLKRRGSSEQQSRRIIVGKTIRGNEFSDAKKLKKLEKESSRLKKLVADLSLDNAILKDVAEGKL